MRYWLVRVGAHGGLTAEEAIHRWLDAGLWALPNPAPVPVQFPRAGHALAFHASGRGVIATSRVGPSFEHGVTLPIRDWPEPRLPSNPRFRPPLEHLLDMLVVPLTDVMWVAPSEVEVVVPSDMSPERMARYFVDEPASDRFAPVLLPIRKAEYLNLTLRPIRP